MPIAKIEIFAPTPMTNKNPHVGSTFESWLDEKVLRDEVTAAAIKRVIADQIAAAM